MSYIEKGNEGRARTERPRRATLKLDRKMREELHALTKPSLGRALLAVVGDWAQIALAGALIYWAIWRAGSMWAWAIIPIGWLVIGTRQRALATILHEAAHRALAKSRLANIMLGSVSSGWWILQIYWRYFRSHVQKHHPWLGDAVRDPDIAQYLRLQLIKQDPKTFLKRNLLELLVGFKTFVNLPYLLRDRLLPEPGTVLKTGEIMEIIAFTTAWVGMLTLLIEKGWLLPFLVIWVVPYLTVFQAVNHLIETMEHFPLIWSRQHAFEWTRNRKGPWFERWAFGAHGEGWHRIHHLFPGIPFWNLARAHEILMGHPVYAAFERESGGIFVRGRNGEPPIMLAMAEELAAYQAASANLLGEMK